MQQAINLSNLPFAFSHIALMPDVHQGYGMPIGGILATVDNMIIPNAVGVDIGCGITALKTDIAEIQTKEIEIILEKAKKLIPVGFNHNKKPQEWAGFNSAPNITIISQELESAR
ncbi:MAG: RtcB family protein, partial [Firmicutes bacterium]|nr:RtcB family protein [Bacillota bacterium]